MVHLKASTGCDKCRERRIKCDELKPNCNRCTKRGLVCPGYRSFGGVVFVDAGKALTSKVKPGKPKQTEQAVVRVSPVKELTIDPQILSIYFFFQNFVQSPERDPLLSRGHFDNLVQMYCTARPDSPISLATSVMAACIFQHYHDTRIEPAWQIKRQMEAHRALQKAVVDPKESLQDDTLMASVLMEISCRLSPRENSHAVSKAHMSGALALVNQRGDESFQSPSSQALLAALRSNVLLYVLWQGDREGYDILKQIPDVRPASDSLAAGLHYFLAKAIVLDVDASLAKAAMIAGERELYPEFWVDSARELIQQLDMWYTTLPMEWQLVVGRRPEDNAMWYPDLPSMPVLYLLGQYHCMKLNLTKIISNLSPDMNVRRQNHAQSRLVYESLRSLFPFFERKLDNNKSSFKGVSQHAAGYDASTPSIYQATTPSGQQYLLNLMRWMLTHVTTPTWCMQPSTEWAHVGPYLRKEIERINASLAGSRRNNRLAALF